MAALRCCIQAADTVIRDGGLCKNQPVTIFHHIMGEAPFLPGLYDGRSLPGGMCCTQARYADAGHDRKAERNGGPWKERCYH